MEQPQASTCKIGFIAGGLEAGKLNWITVANLSRHAVSLVGWTLQTEENAAQRLTGMLEPGDTKRIESEMKLNEKGVVKLMNGAGELIDRFTYETGANASESCGIHGSGKTLEVLCAMVNAIGDEFENEFVVLANMSKVDVKLADYSLSDCKHTPLALGTKTLRPGETVKVTKMYDQRTGVGVSLNNRRGSIQILSGDKVIDEVEYADNRDNRIEEGVPVSFHVDWNTAANIKISQTVPVSRELDVTQVSAAVTQPNTKKNGVFYTPFRYVLPAVAIAWALCKICKAYKRRARAA